MIQPNGKAATISFVTVGGRTSAFVEEIQRLPEGVAMKAKVSRKIKVCYDILRLDR